MKIDWKKIPVPEELPTVAQQFNKLKKKFPGLTQYRFAKIVGISPQTISLWRKNNTRPKAFYFISTGFTKHVNLNGDRNNSFDM